MEGLVAELILFNPAVQRAVACAAARFLLPVVPHIEGLLLQPLGQFDFRDGVGNALENSWDTHHFLNLSGESFEVVSPVENAPNVHFAFEKRVVLGPPVEEVTLHLHLSIKDLSGNRPLSDWPVMRVSRNHKVATQPTFALDDVWPQELG